MSLKSVLTVVRWRPPILKGLKSISPALTRSGYAGTAPTSFINPERVVSSHEIEFDERYVWD